MRRESEFIFKEAVRFDDGTVHMATSTSWLAGEAGATIIDQSGAEVFVPWWNIVSIYTASGS